MRCSHRPGAVRVESMEPRRLAAKDCDGARRVSVAAPPPVTPPSLDELEALIREARTRQRKRKSIAATSVVGAVSIGLGLWAGLRGGSGLPPVDRGPNATLIRTRSVGASQPRGPIYQVGSSGGVTWTIGLYRMWLTTDQGRKWRFA